MINLPPEYWLLVHLVIDFLLVVFFVFYLRSLKAKMQDDSSRESVRRIIAIIEPVVKDARETAETFEKQIAEKKRLISDLNRNLDNRIISLNLLANRAEACCRFEPENPGGETSHVYEQQNAILELHEKGLESTEIASKLSLPRGEVDLVIDLKKKMRQF